LIALTFVAYILDLMAFGLNAYGQPNNQVFYAVVGLATLAPAISVLSRRDDGRRHANRRSTRRRDCAGRLGCCDHAVAAWS
jgi:uncharacterized membrane protein YuzA (DUF378 family)